MTGATSGAGTAYPFYPKKPNNLKSLLEKVNEWPKQVSQIHVN
jgi:hypothetical protein